MRTAVSFIIVLSTIVMAISVEEKARLDFGRALDLWVEGKFESSLKILENLLYKPINVEDIPKFWYLRARVDVDLGNVEKALKELQSVLVVDPTSVEVLSLMREIEYLTGKRGFKQNYKLKKIGKIEGFKDSVEYFYTLDDVDVFGNTIYAIDRVNERLLKYEDFKLVSTIDLPFKPLSLEVSRSGVPFVSSVDGGIYMVSGGITQVATGLNTPILAGFDRFGRLWGISGFSVFVFDGRELEKREITWGRPLIIDAEVSKDGIWILDVMHRRIALLDFKDLRIKKDIPTSIDMRSFEVVPYGGFLVLTADGNVLYMDENQNVENLKIDAKDVVAFEYRYPIFMTADWREHEVDVYSFAGDEPLLVKIDSMDVDKVKNKVHMRVRFENLYGDPIPMAGRFAFVSVDGGRRSFEIRHTLERVEKYISDVDFLSDKIFSVRRGIGYDVMIPVKSYVEKDIVVTLRDKSVRVFSSAAPEGDDLKSVIEMSGGEFGYGDVLESVREIWKIDVDYTPSLSIKITPVTVGIVLGTEIYSDTLYIVERGVVGGS